MKSAVASFPMSRAKQVGNLGDCRHWQNDRLANTLKDFDCCLMFSFGGIERG